jgi:hypothetical protein
VGTGIDESTAGAQNVTKTPRRTWVAIGMAVYLAVMLGFRLV